MQHSLLRMIEPWEDQLTNGTKFSAIIMDLSKAFDSLNHNLLLTKLKAYRLKINPSEFFIGKSGPITFQDFY